VTRLRAITDAGSGALLSILECLQAHKLALKTMHVHRFGHQLLELKIEFDGLCAETFRRMLA
jgi:hypothetical protein